MEYKWLNRQNNDSVIIFFNGWGMDESVLNHLGFENYDVLMFYDYNSLDTDFDFEEVKKYPKRYLVAWSMGVMVATIFADKFEPLEKAVAINGSMKPVDNKFGIPERIYDLTVKNFSPQGAEKFIKNMFWEDCPMPDCKRDFENQKSELAALRNYASNQDFKYTKVLLSTDDKIIPTSNQAAFWNIDPNIKSGHCPFNLFKAWGEIL